MDEVITIDKITPLLQYVSIEALVLEKQQESDFLVGDKTGTILVNILGSTEGELTVGQTYQIQNAKISSPHERLHLYLGNWGKIQPSTTPLTLDDINQDYVQFSDRGETSPSHRSAWNLFLSIITFRFLGKIFRR